MFTHKVSRRDRDIADLPSFFGELTDHRSILIRNQQRSFGCDSNRFRIETNAARIVGIGQGIQRTDQRFTLAICQQMCLNKLNCHGIRRRFVHSNVYQMVSTSIAAGAVRWSSVRDHGIAAPATHPCDSGTMASQTVCRNSSFQFSLFLGKIRRIRRDRRLPNEARFGGGHPSAPQTQQHDETDSQHYHRFLKKWHSKKGVA